MESAVPKRKPGNPNLKPRFVKGQSGNPNGRPKGRKTDPKKRAMYLSEEARIALAKRMGISPLEFMLSTLRDPKASFRDKLDVAKAAAPYMHRKMPIGIDNGMGGPVGFYTLDQLARLDTEQLLKVRDALAVLNASGILPAGIPQDTAILGAGLGAVIEEQKDVDG